MKWDKKNTLLIFKSKSTIKKINETEQYFKFPNVQLYQIWILFFSKINIYVSHMVLLYFDKQSKQVIYYLSSINLRNIKEYVLIIKAWLKYNMENLIPYLMK